MNFMPSYALYQSARPPSLSVMHKCNLYASLTHSEICSEQVTGDCNLFPILELWQSSVRAGRAAEGITQSTLQMQAHMCLSDLFGTIETKMLVMQMDCMPSLCCTHSVQEVKASTCLCKTR